jgi:hypothetical protein
MGRASKVSINSYFIRPLSVDVHYTHSADGKTLASQPRVPSERHQLTAHLQSTEWRHMTAGITTQPYVHKATMVTMTTASSHVH